MTSESVWHIPLNVCTALKNNTKYKEKQPGHQKRRNTSSAF